MGLVNSNHPLNIVRLEECRCGAAGGLQVLVNTVSKVKGQVFIKMRKKERRWRLFLLSHTYTEKSALGVERS